MQPGLVARCDVVLVGTANPENLGGVARLVANFAPAGWWLVAPRARADDPRALVVGRMAQTALASVRVAATIDEAVAEAACVVGFSARRGAARPTVALTALAAELAARAAARGAWRSCSVRRTRAWRRPTSIAAIWWPRSICRARWRR